MPKKSSHSTHHSSHHSSRHQSVGHYSALPPGRYHAHREANLEVTSRGPGRAPTITAWEYGHYRYSPHGGASGSSNHRTVVGGGDRAYSTAPPAQIGYAPPSATAVPPASGYAQSIASATVVPEDSISQAGGRRSRSSRYDPSQSRVPSSHHHSRPPPTYAPAPAGYIEAGSSHSRHGSSRHGSSRHGSLAPSGLHAVRERVAELRSEAMSHHSRSSHRHGSDHESRSGHHRRSHY